jgi:hypothetical protein
MGMLRVALIALSGLLMGFAARAADTVNVYTYLAGKLCPADIPRVREGDRPNCGRTRSRLHLYPFKSPSLAY